MLQADFQHGWTGLSRLVEPTDRSMVRRNATDAASLGGPYGHAASSEVAPKLAGNLSRTKVQEEARAVARGAYPAL